MKKSPLTMGGDFFMPVGNKTDSMHIILYIIYKRAGKSKKNDKNKRKVRNIEMNLPCWQDIINSYIY